MVGRVSALAAAILVWAAIPGAAAAKTFSASCSGTTGNVAALVKAINQANASPGADTVALGKRCTYTLTAVNNNWYGPNGLPAIASNITIDGDGATIARGQTSSVPPFRLFFVGANPSNADTLDYVSPGSGSLTLRDVTLTGGLAQGGDAIAGGGGAGMGGAIFSQGHLAIDQTTLTGNEAVGGTSGGSEGFEGGGGMGQNSGDAGGGFGGSLPGSVPSGGAGGPNGGGGGGGGGFAVGENGLPGAPSGNGPGGGVFTGLGGAGCDGPQKGGDGSGSGGGASGSESTETGGVGGAFGQGGQAPTGNGGLVAAGGGGGVGGGGAEGEDGGGGGFGGGGGEGYCGGAGGFGGGGGSGYGLPNMGSTGGPGGFGGDTATYNDGGAGAGMGGAIFAMQGSLTITNSTLTANTALGGADQVDGHAMGIAGAVFNLNGDVIATGSTFAKNTGADLASQIFNLEYDGHQARTAQTTLRDTIVADGIGAPYDLASLESALNITPPMGALATADVSQFDLVQTMNGTITGSPLLSNPMLGPLKNNGGLTPTMKPAANSPVIDAGQAFTSTDQRGDPRPVDFPGIPNAPGGDGADIGAVEVQKACTNQRTPSQICQLSVTAVHQSNSEWREASKSAVISRAQKPPVGTAFSFVLNEPAKVALVFTRLPGHGASATKAGTLTLSGQPGKNTVRFYGMLSRAKTLMLGRYQLRVTATNHRGQRASSKPLVFTIVKP